MCDFPSGYKFADGTVKFHTDEDVIAAHEKSGDTQPINWQDWVGHEGWRRCFGVPPSDAVQIESSAAMPFALSMLDKMSHLIEGYGSLDVRGCDLKGVKLPGTVGGSLDVSGCDLKGVKLPGTVGSSLDVSGCDLNGVKLPGTVGGSLYVSGCDLKGVTNLDKYKLIK